MADRIIATMRRPFEIDGRSVTLTSSIGIAVYPVDGKDAQTLLKHADSAMYHAKRLGRDNTQLYSSAFTQEATDRLDLDSGLRGALAREEFHLLYQPVIDLASGRLVSVEALVRWQHPVRGLISPATFIPIAEENGVIAALGNWVLNRACADLPAWRRAVIEKYVATLAALHTFRDHGVRIALDDFGTGYSSLSYLRQIPIDIIKVDRSFVGRLAEGGRSTAIVEAILALARALGLSVTAEGVETHEQAAALKTMECQNVQGYLFSRPVPAAEIAQLALADWRIGASLPGGSETAVEDREFG